MGALRDWWDDARREHPLLDKPGALLRTRVVRFVIGPGLAGVGAAISSGPAKLAFLIPGLVLVELSHFASVRHEAYERGQRAGIWINWALQDIATLLDDLAPSIDHLWEAEIKMVDRKKALLLHAFGNADHTAGRPGLAFARNEGSFGLALAHNSTATMGANEAERVPTRHGMPGPSDGFGLNADQIEALSDTAFVVSVPICPPTAPDRPLAVLSIAATYRDHDGQRRLLAEQLQWIAQRVAVGTLPRFQRLLELMDFRFPALTSES